ncbi:hypothetical protein BCR35DRAFT_334429 [Leucosporidium creatinivorum]|uniref:Uncharacterized protein n=1 Tax=Leucosporidium creatinivorum TaxID=106004 RepID=A0A1Y2EB46_9BASI|nr:hypothetical protein BCR35DRAFT_334429 [Leucosporidium creatinivorum]
MLHRYMDKIAAKMVRAAKHPYQGNEVVYLCAKHFLQLDPLRRAHGVLAAKAYEENGGVPSWPCRNGKNRLSRSTLRQS